MSIASETIVLHLIQERTRLLGYAWAIVADAHAAEDIFQEVSLAVIKKADQITDPQHLDAWLLKAIRLKGLEWRRNQKHKAKLLGGNSLDALEQAWAQHPGDAASEKSQALQRCMGELTDAARLTLDMRHTQGMPPQVIAKRLNRNIQAVYKTIYRAHAALRECVQRRLDVAKGAL